MGWKISNHGLQVEEEAFKSDYILFQTRKVRAIYRHYNTAGTVKEVPAWIKSLVVKLKNWSKEVWTSSFVKMTPATASTAIYVALIRKKHYKKKIIVSEDDESSSSSEEEYLLSKTKRYAHSQITHSCNDQHAASLQPVNVNVVH